MVDKYCPTCGKEIKTEFRTKPDIKSNISSILGFDVWKLQGDKKTLLKLEKAIKMLTKPEANSKVFKSQDIKKGVENGRQ